MPPLQQNLLQMFGEPDLGGCMGMDGDMRDCYQVRKHLESCPTCAGKHACDLWYIYEQWDSCFTMRNSAYGCSERLLPVLTNPHLENIANNASSDVNYADFFISEHPRTFVSDGVKILRFDGIRWLEVRDLNMITIAQDWLKDVMRKLFKLVEYEATMHRLHKTKPPEWCKKYSMMYSATDKYLGKESNIKIMLGVIKRKLYDQDLWTKMDANPLLLGLSNGVYDFSARTFRAAVYEDMVSRSVGYEWVQHPDLEAEAAVDEFFCQLYPVEEEREVAKLWAAYTMCGHHPEKKFMMLTDKRGKTTHLYVLLHSMF